MLGLGLLAGGELESERPLVGTLLLIMIAYACEAVAFVYSKRLRAEHGLFEYMSVLQLSAAVFMWGVVFSGNEPWPDHVPMKAWLALVFVALVACVVCYGILYWLLRYIPGHQLAVFDGFHVISSTTFGALLFGERLTAPALAGGALLLVSLGIITLPTSRSAPDSAIIPSKTQTS